MIGTEIEGAMCLVCQCGHTWSGAMVSFLGTYRGTP